ncbi:MAG: flagellar hook-associated protein FlgK [Desulfobacterota bacterium]|nr:flagellar hook-associated protein FlgK [Thermodesulfobacteriota bacterium]
MSGIRNVIDIAKGALLANQKAMTVISHNIANVNTPGYTRQRMILEANPPYFANRLKIGMGVKAESVVQFVDPFVNRSIHQKTSLLKEHETRASVLSQMEVIFNETKGQGLVQALNEFWNAWQDVASSPNGISERTALLAKGEVLTRQFHVMSESLHQMKSEMNTNLKISLQEVNQLVRQIAELNEKIVFAESNQTMANDLRDQRSSHLERLSEYLGNVYVTDAHGAWTVMTPDGMILVDGKHYWQLRMEGDAIYWNNIPNDISKKIQGGKIGAWLDLRDDLIPQTIANLDELAGALIREVNALHVRGYTLGGETGLNFFAPFKAPPETPHLNDFTGAASYIRLSDEVRGLPVNVAAARAPGAPGDNENALRIVSLQTDGSLSLRRWNYAQRGLSISSTLQIGTLDDYYRMMVGEIGILVDEASENHDFTKALMDHLTALRDSVSGVNLEEEMVELMKIQRAHEAASKLVTITDEMLQSLLAMR